MVGKSSVNIESWRLSIDAIELITTGKNNVLPYGRRAKKRMLPSSSTNFNLVWRDSVTYEVVEVRKASRNPGERRNGRDLAVLRQGGGQGDVAHCSASASLWRMAKVA